ncbi:MULTISPECIES: hypothetical protein [Bifidobacterium]|uniref:hypothetical protein n=1 Tax=Bifidobacterium TaxID=1678 RepID=UPI001BDDA646|nr:MULTISPECIES: hypothetical protein [Bifidobacterium]MBT1160997.1 hypothetical protein [Bifidobacterium sp. SO1]MBW3079527.1 hypothetical protein [Bifidobacterium simiiventris]
MSDVILGPTNPNHEVAGALAEPGVYEIMFDPRNRRPRSKRQRLLIVAAFVLVALLMVASLARLTVATPPKLRITLVDAGQYGSAMTDLAKDFTAAAKLRERDVTVTTLDGTDKDRLHESLRRLRRDNTADLVIAPVATFDRLAGDDYVERFDENDVSALIAAQSPSGDTSGANSQAQTGDEVTQPATVLRKTWYELPIDGTTGHAPGVGTLQWTCTQQAANGDANRFTSTTCTADVSGYTDGNGNALGTERRTYAPASVVAIPNDADVTATAPDGSKTWTQTGPMTIRQTAVYGLRMDTSDRWTAMLRRTGTAANGRTDYVMGMVSTDQIQSGTDAGGPIYRFIGYLKFSESADSD